MTGARAADAMLHPLALASLAALIANDHWLKLNHPSTLSGKLSDVAVLVVLPLALQATWEVARPDAPRPSRRALLAAVALTAAMYTLEKVWAPGTQAYRMTWGALRWPLDALGSFVRGRGLPPYRPVAAVRDPTDLVALPALCGAWWVQRARERRTPSPVGGMNTAWTARARWR